MFRKIVEIHTSNNNNNKKIRHLSDEKKRQANLDITNTLEIKFEI